MKDYANRESSSGEEDEAGTVSLDGVLGLELSSQSICVNPAEVHIYFVVIFFVHTFKRSNYFLCSHGKLAYMLFMM